MQPSYTTQHCCPDQGAYWENILVSEGSEGSLQRLTKFKTSPGKARAHRLAWPSQKAVCEQAQGAGREPGAGVWGRLAGWYSDTHIQYQYQSSAKGTGMGS